MPYTFSSTRECQNCKIGPCVSYIREQSRRMKDRDTQYRLAQNIGMACCFDSYIPGDISCPVPSETPITEFVEKLVSNAHAAGEALESISPNHFGATEKPFFLTPAQIGKVRGDVYETLARTILWNCCVHRNTAGSSPKIAVLSLGDN